MNVVVWSVVSCHCAVLKMNESCFTLGDGEQTSSGRVRMKICEFHPRDALTSMSKSPAAPALAHGIADPLWV